LLHAADDAADELEDAGFLLALLAEAGPPMSGHRHKQAPGPQPMAEQLQVLAGLALEATQEWLKALLHAAHAEDHGAAEDADDFLVAIDRIAALEHAADDAERALNATAVRQAADFRQFHLYTAIGAKLEDATDALQHAGRMLREHLLGEVLGG
jgi:uncharacterized protein Yka (UPF0111/DUF47 family)